MKKIGILYICTGEYYKFWENFYNSSEKFFLTEEEKHYFIFTDNELILSLKNDRIHSIFQKNMEWPYPTLYRYKIFINNEDKFLNMDYLIFCNANLIFKKTISLNNLFNGNNMFATLHPGFYNKDKIKLPYETNTKSLAFVKKNVNSVYVCGGFNGGKKIDFLNMAKKLDKNIDIDLKNKIIALWHDESHINKFFVDNKNNFNLLSPSYCYAENMKLGLDETISVQDKDIIISIVHKGFFYQIRYYLIKNIRYLHRKFKNI